MADSVTLDDIPYQDAISTQFERDWAVGRPDLPTVNLPDDFVLTPVEPMSLGKTYEVLIDTKYNPRDVPGDSDVTAVATNQTNPSTITTVTLRYAEVSETYLGSDGNYYVATFTRIYVPADDQYAGQYDGVYQENQGTLSAPGLTSYQIGNDPAIIGDTHATNAGDFARIRSATPEEIAIAQDRRQDAIDNGFVLKPNGTFDSPQSCFGPEVPIDMWPLDLTLKPRPDGIYDQDEVRAKIWQKPIETVSVGDLVVSFDDGGNLVPGYVPRTMTNEVKILLNFFGTRVTPGHVYYRADSNKAYKFETLIDVLRDDGVIQHQDGSMIRAATNVPVGDVRDGFVQAVTGPRNPDGNITTLSEGRIRLGTRFIVDGNRTYTVADLIEAGGGTVGEDELIRVEGGAAMPFHWEFSDTLPLPEDFVLECSGTTLEDIYKAAEWEDQAPRMPAPVVLDGGPVQPSSDDELKVMPRNEPLDLNSSGQGSYTASTSNSDRVSDA
ncbi:MAG: hypothetical protein ABJH45_09365 [Paracoccaceae bacterium]